MTGAPKVRAMEIIDELEPERAARTPARSATSPAGGQRMDLAITIRTCVIADGMASVQAGAGIVADSVPEREWEETENKAQALLTAIASVRQSRVKSDMIGMQFRRYERFEVGRCARRRGGGVRRGHSRGAGRRSGSTSTPRDSRTLFRLSGAHPSSPSICPVGADEWWCDTTCAAAGWRR